MLKYCQASSRSGTISRNQIVAEKDWNNCQTASSFPVQPEERTCSLSVVCEGWDKKMKRKRSVGLASKRALNNDFNQNLHLKLSAGSKFTFHASGSRAETGQDDSIRNSSTRIKIKNSKTSSAASTLVHPPDIQASNEASDGWEHVSVSNTVPLDMIYGQSCGSNSPHAQEPLVGQRSHKILCARRVDAVSSPVIESDEAQNPSPGLATSGAARDSSSGISKCVAYSASDSAIQECGVRLEKVSGPVPLSDGKQSRFSENHMKAVQECDVVTPDNSMKIQGSVFPKKQGKMFASVDGVAKQDRKEAELRTPRARNMDKVGKLENAPKTMSLENIVPSFKKTRSKSGRPPSGKRTDRRTFPHAGKKLQSQDPAEVDDDYEEKLAAAASARKASHRACSSQFWRKVEPIFGPVSTEDKCYLKQQLSTGEKLEDSLSQFAAADFNALGALMFEESAQAEKPRESSYLVFNKADKVATQEGGGKGLDKVSSLYERVLAALIEEDESVGIYNIVEGISTSIQCASDDSHCDSCNYADIEMRDRDKLDSEAESKFDVEMQKCCCGDRFSCNRSVTSNTTRNASVSDSLYSSGRCQGDDLLSHSDEFVSGMWQNDQGGSLLGDVNTHETRISNCQYRLMCVDERLVLELQSIGLLLDTLPDLAEEEEEVIDHDIMEHLEVLHQRIVKKKMNLRKVDKAIQDGRERDKQDIVQFAMDKLVEMAYKGRMVFRADQDSKRVIRKVSKQVAMGFMRRTVARCQTFEFTGQSCFHEPSLQKSIFSAIEGEQADCVGLRVEHSRPKAPNYEPNARGSGVDSTVTALGSSHHDPGTRSLGSVRAGKHFPAYGPPEHGLPQKGKKKDLLLNDVDCDASSQRVAGCVRALARAKGKRSERDVLHKRDMMKSSTIFESNQLVLGTFGSGHRMQEKYMTTENLISPPVSKCGSKSDDAVPCIRPCPSIQPKSFGTKESGTGLELTSPEVVIQHPLKEAEKPHRVEIDPLEDLGVLTDIGSWFEDDRLQDCDSIGLEVPKDDIHTVF
ncbi:hypothetical protein Dimus_009380 [Dionaea muscipula]